MLFFLLLIGLLATCAWGVTAKEARDIQIRCDNMCSSKQLKQRSQCRVKCAEDLKKEALLHFGPDARLVKPRDPKAPLKHKQAMEAKKKLRYAVVNGRRKAVAP